MTGHEYLQGVLDSQTVSSQVLTQLQSNRENIEYILRQEYGQTPRIYYGGSYGKKTMVAATFDLDIVVYFPPTYDQTLKDIYRSVYFAISKVGYSVNCKTVALELRFESGFHIDVVPGKAQANDFKYATLFKNTAVPSTLQTSLKVHIDAVRKIRDVIRLLKLWRFRHGIIAKTFVLELLACRAMEGRSVDDLANSMLHALEFIRDKVSAIRLVDPANTNNIVEIDVPMRNALMAAAATSLQAKNWGDIVW